MGSALQLEPTVAQPDVVADLRELLMFRRGLIKDRTATRTRLKTARQGVLRRFLAQRLAQVERQIVRIDATMQALIASDAGLTERLNILVSIPGISLVSATALLADMPELGSLSGKEAAALAGLAPISRQSGQWRGQEHIQGGRQSVRQVLFMPALSAIQHNSSAKAKFEDLVQAGKRRKVAVTAVMRKLIVLANALLRDGRKWGPEPT